MQKIDKLYRDKLEYVGDFCFDEKTVEVFDDMLNRSIPCYRKIINNIILISKYHMQNKKHIDTYKSTFYDLGASTGSISCALSYEFPYSCIYAVDSSEPMYKELNANIKANPSFSNIRPILNDASKVNFEASDIVISNFTMQFVNKSLRADLLGSIRSALMKKNGIFIISEKVLLQDNHIEFLYDSYKQSKGYTKNEIEQKKRALKSVMHLDTPEDIETNLAKAKFSHVTKWFQCFNFMSWIAFA